MVIEFEVAVGTVAQGLLEVITTVTTSLLASEEVMNEALLVPAGLPFTFQAYDGFVPPKVFVAEKVTAVPPQMLFPKLLVMVTVGAALDDTVSNAALPVGAGAQPESTGRYL